MLTHAGTQAIETPRLTLRRFAYEDNASMRTHWASDPAIQRMYSEPTYTTEAEARGLLDLYIAGYERPDYYRWAVSLRGEPDCIGQIAYFKVDDTNHWAEVEYCVGQAFQGRGYITEAMQSVLRYGFERVNLHKVQVCHKANNPASGRVIEKCGFVYEGALRDYFFMDGAYVDRLYYSLMRDEWEGQK